jgi:hypothetical protein
MSDDTGSQEFKTVRINDVCTVLRFEMETLFRLI